MQSNAHWQKESWAWIYMVFNNETHKIESCDEEKDLGVTFDTFLSFDLHIKME